MFKLKVQTASYMLAYALAVLQVSGQSTQTSAATATLTTVSRYVDNVTTVNNISIATPNTTVSNSTSSEPLTALDTESTSRMVILIVVSVLVVVGIVAIWVMWRRSRRGLPPRPNGQVPRPPAETEDLSTVLQNPGFISSSPENEQLSGLSIRLAEDDADDSTVYHELHKSSPSPNEELMDEFYPIEIPEDDRG